ALPARPRFGILDGELVAELRVQRRVLDDLAGGAERRPLRRADRDLRLRSSPTDALHAPRLGRRADPHRVVHQREPDLGRLAERAVLARARDVGVLRGLELLALL